MEVARKEISHRSHSRWDLFGMVLSLACGVHCVALPALMGALPLFGLELFHDPAFEWLMVGLISTLATTVFVRGYLLHRRKAVFVLLAAGLISFIALRPFAEAISHETTHIVTVFGGLAFIAGHWYNSKWSRSRCATCQH